MSSAPLSQIKAVDGPVPDAFLKRRALPPPELVCKKGVSSFTHQKG